MTETATRATALAALAILLLAGTAHAQTLTIQDFIGSIETVPGDTLRVDGADAVTDRQGADITVDGGETLRRIRCRVDNDRVRVNRKPLSDYPALRVTLPKGAVLEVENSILFGTVGDLADASIQLPSCGRLDIGDVGGTLTTRISGSADITAGDIGTADLMTSGSGDVEIARSGSLTFRSTGSGDLAARDVDGAASLTLTGSGDAVISSVGAGLDHRATGSGDLLVGRVSGPVGVVLSGSGDVEIESGEIEVLDFRSTGSGDMVTKASLGDVEVSTTGSGDLQGPTATGRVSVRSTGSGRTVLGGERYR